MADLNSFGLTKKQVAEALLSNIENISKVYDIIQKYLSQTIVQEEMREEGYACDAVNDPENAIRASRRTFRRVSIEQLEEAWNDYAESHVFLDSVEQQQRIAEHMSKYIRMCIEGLEDDKFIYSKAVVFPQDYPCKSCPIQQECTEENQKSLNERYRHIFNMKCILKGINTIEGQKAYVSSLEL